MSKSSIALQKRVEYLADVLVPDKFKYSEPQFYAMIQSFLYFLNDAQTMNNSNFLDAIDVTNVTSDEILYVYFETYLKTLGLPPDTQFSNANDFLRVSKELAGLKGTPFLYAILANLLVYLVPGIKSEYQILLESLTDPTLTPEEIADIEATLQTLEDEGKTGVTLTLSEDAVFEYSIYSNISQDAFDIYVKPFCHPAGWKVSFFQEISKTVVDYLFMYESMKVVSAFTFPDANIYIFGEDPNAVFPTGLCTDVYYCSDLQEAGGTVEEEPLTDFYTVYPLGLEADYDTFVSQVTIPANLYIDAGYVYYTIGQVTLSQDTTTREVTTSSTTDEEVINVRYTDPSTPFPQTLYQPYMQYLTNNPAIRVNGGALTNYNGISLAYDMYHTRDIID